VLLIKPEEKCLQLSCEMFAVCFTPTDSHWQQQSSCRER